MALFKKNNSIDEVSQAFAAANKARPSVEAVYDGKDFIYKYPFPLRKGDVVIISRTGETRDVKSAKMDADMNTLFCNGDAVETADDFSID